MSFSILDHDQCHNLASKLYTILSLKFPDQDISELSHYNYFVKYDFPRNLLSVKYNDSFIFVASYAANHQKWYEIDTREISRNAVDILHPINEQVLSDLLDLIDDYSGLKG